MSLITARTPLVFHPDDEETYGLNFTPAGIGSATISSVDSIDVDKISGDGSAGDLSFDDLDVNSGTEVGERGQPVATGKMALFTMTGGTAGTNYLLTVNVTLSTGAQLHRCIRAECRDS